MQGQMATDTTDVKVTEGSLVDVSTALEDTEQDCQAKVEQSVW